MGSVWSTLKWNYRKDDELEGRAKIAFEHYRCGYKETGSPDFDCAALLTAEQSIFDTLMHGGRAVVDPEGYLMYVGNKAAVAYFYKYTAKYNKMVLAAAMAGVPFACPACECRKKKKQLPKIKEQMAKDPSGHGLESKPLATVDNSLPEDKGDQSSSQLLSIKSKINQIWPPLLIFPFVYYSGIFQRELYIYIQSNRKDEIILTQMRRDLIECDSQRSSRWNSFVQFWSPLWSVLIIGKQEHISLNSHVEDVFRFITGLAFVTAQAAAAKNYLSQEFLKDLLQQCAIHKINFF
eukprot:TRINITY_DN8206_c0_g1_i1.p2 TRINITY_DN8206_c0_g1~~TRINITY_DN8206_c0_g1_i1.p2  ORF type:complete len:293 (-),score=-0.41 TRINITY_DN8206_c0_g1_i1:1169-2047(-)